MNHFCRFFSILVSLLALLPPLRAVDLSNLERTIVKEPAYRSSPKYCLLLFGLGTDRRVWLVLDGNEAYIDRNGNGDLTEDGERMRATPAGRSTLRFELGDIPDGDCVHKQLRLLVDDAALLTEGYDEVKALCARQPEARVYQLWLDTEIPGFRGTAVGGRVKQRVNPVDRSGVLQFGSDPAKAPVINFAGVWQILLEERPQLVVGRRAELFLAIGTPGVGPGSTAYIAHEGLVPESTRASVQIAFPPAQPDQHPIEARYATAHRCCIYNFFAPIEVPASATAGLSAVTLSLDGWNEAAILASAWEVEVALPRPGPPPVPLSTRLVRSLIHPRQHCGVGKLHFSPDGRRIMGCDFPGAVLQVWDVETGKELTTIDFGSGLVNRWQSVIITPDSRTAFVSRSVRDMTAVERGGRQFNHWQVNGELRAWDVTTGQLLRTYAHDPPRGIEWILMAPDGSSFVTEEVLSGESESGPKMAYSLWEAKSGEPRPLPVRDATPCVYTADGKALVAFDGKAAGESARVDFIHVQTATVSRSLYVGKQADQQLESLQFVPNSSLLLGGLGLPGRMDKNHLMFCDLATGRRLAKFGQDSFLFTAFSPNGEIVAVTNYRRRGPAKLYLFDAHEPSLKCIILLDKHSFAFQPAFSPDGKWLAVGTQQYLDGIGVTDPDCPQPRIHLIDVAKAKVRETLIAPQGVPSEVIFSPSGRLLASSGSRCVHLWNLADPPIGGSDGD